MNAKKFFHQKLIEILISIVTTTVLIALAILPNAVDVYVVITVGFLTLIVTTFYSIVKSTVRKIINQPYKLNKEWFVSVILIFFSLVFCLIAFYSAEQTYRIIAIVLIPVSFSLFYCSYRFLYLPKIFYKPEVLEETLYFSWRDWAKMLDKGAKVSEVASNIKSAQIKSNFYLNSHTWGARFDFQKEVNPKLSGESGVPDNNVDIPLSKEVSDRLYNNALAIANSYKKKIKE